MKKIIAAVVISSVSAVSFAVSADVQHSMVVPKSAIVVTEDPTIVPNPTPITPTVVAPVPVATTNAEAAAPAAVTPVDDTASADTPTTTDTTTPIVTSPAPDAGPAVLPGTPAIGTTTHIRN